jgi:Na+/melibiose symporter-like transporter
VLSKGGKWAAVFYFSAAICVIAAIAARFLLKPLRERYLGRQQEQDTGAMLPQGAAAD